MYDKVKKQIGYIKSLERLGPGRPGRKFINSAYTDLSILEGQAEEEMAEWNRENRKRWDRNRKESDKKMNKFRAKMKEERRASGMYGTYGPSLVSTDKYFYGLFGEAFWQANFTIIQPMADYAQREEGKSHFINLFNSNQWILLEEICANAHRFKIEINKKEGLRVRYFNKNIPSSHKIWTWTETKELYKLPRLAIRSNIWSFLEGFSNPVSVYKAYGYVNYSSKDDSEMDSLFIQLEQFAKTPNKIDKKINKAEDKILEQILK